MLSHFIIVALLKNYNNNRFLWTCVVTHCRGYGFCPKTCKQKTKKPCLLFWKWHAIPAPYTRKGKNTCCLNCLAAFSICWKPSSRLLLASSSFFRTRLWLTHLDTKMAVADPQSTAETKHLSTSTSGKSPFTFSRAMFWQLLTGELLKPWVSESEKAKRARNGKGWWFVIPPRSCQFQAVGKEQLVCPEVWELLASSVKEASAEIHRLHVFYLSSVNSSWHSNMLYSQQ